MRGSSKSSPMTIAPFSAPGRRGSVRPAGTLRENGKRRAFVRFFACQEDLSHTSYDDPLPAAVTDGREPFLVVGAMAGG